MAKSAIKFKDSVRDFEAMKAAIAAKKFAPVYLLMGEEGWFIDELAERLAEDVLSDAEKAFGRVVVYGKDSDAGAIINLARQMPMMGSHQVVIVREAQQLRKIEELQLYTANPSPSTVLVLCHKEKNLDKRTQLYKHVSAKGAVFEAVRPRDYEVREWLGNLVAQKGMKAEPKALEMLTEYLGTDIAKISNELEKLFLSLPEAAGAAGGAGNAARLTAEDVERGTGFSREYNNFELCKAIAARDEKRAMAIAENFAQNPKEHPLIVSIMALFGQFKEIFIYNYCVWQARNKGLAMPSDMELMTLLRVPGPWAVDGVKTAAAKWPNKITFKVLGLIREYDAKSKGMNAGGMSDGELLRELLLKIFLIR